MIKQIAIAFSAFIASQNASAITVNFYTDKAAFDAMATTTTVDFEGIVGDLSAGTPSGGLGVFTQSEVIEDVTFSTWSGGTLGVTGKNTHLSGDPYDSALLFAFFPQNRLTANLSSAGSAFNAVGGFFGDINSAGTLTDLTLLGTTGVLDVRSMETADMGRGTESNFFGWIIEGDEIISITHHLRGGYSGIDNFQYGTSNNVPEAGATIILLGFGLFSLPAFRKLST